MFSVFSHKISLRDECNVCNIFSRAKEEAKQMQEELEKRKKEQAENERLAEKARKEAHRQAVESSLPPEPQQGAGDGIMKVRVRLPAGEYLERKFQSDTPLQTLFNFLIVEGYPTEEYKILSCSDWPRRDVSSYVKQYVHIIYTFCSYFISQTFSCSN